MQQPQRPALKIPLLLSTLTITKLQVGSCQCKKLGDLGKYIFYDTISDIISSVEQVTDPATNFEAKKSKRKKRKDKEEILVEPIITPKNILSSLRHVSF